MNIKIDHSQKNPFTNAAQQLVYNYMADCNLKSINQELIEKKVDVIVNQLLLSKVYNADEKKINNIVLPIDVFPEDMKEWAIKKIFNNEPLSSLNPVSDSSSKQVTIASYSFNNRDWSDVNVIQRAGGGTRGAYFLRSQMRGDVVIKGQQGALEQLMGTAFLRCMGFNAPDSRLVLRSSKEGIQLSKLADEHGLNQYHPTHYIVMDRVKGKSFDEMKFDIRALRLLETNFEALGELATYDLVIGNTDRINFFNKNLNAGNIMFENEILIPIDTDVKPYDENNAELVEKRYLPRIINGTSGFETLIVSILIDHLDPEFCKKEENKQKIQEYENSVKTGMSNGIQKLKFLYNNLAINKQKYIETCHERGGDDLKIFPQHLVNNLTAIQRNIK